MNNLYLVICMVALAWAFPATGNTLNVPAQYPTIQAGIDAATHGDTVLVAAGAYTENLVWQNKSLALIGAGADVTTVDGGGTGRCLTMQNVPSTARVEGFTFTGGTGAFVDGQCRGGGLYLEDSSPRLTANTITGNSALAYMGFGGGLCLERSSATLVNNSITGNSAIYCGGGLGIRNSSPHLTNNTITYNSASGGGGVYIWLSSPTLTDNTIMDNSSDWAGGGLLLYESSPTLTNNTITGNSTGNRGGGLSLNWYSCPTLIGNTITGNSSQCYGGGLFSAYYSSARLTGNTITGNSATVCGGGLFLERSDPTVTNNTISDNSASSGGGVYLAYSSPTMTNNTIVWNPGGGLDNNTVYPGTPVITNCILWGNGGCDLYNACATYSDIGTGQLTGEGNISAHPMFVDAIAGDYHLQDASPCIDAGSNSAPALPDTDKDGNPRIVGAAVDMGAYECQGPKVSAVAIDIKPGSYPNAINLGSHGLIPVAILSSDQFDATTVDPETVELAGAGVAVRGKSNKYMAHKEDVNADGLVDLVVQVATENLDPESLQDGFAILTGKMFDGLPIEGKDQITIVPPEK